MRPEIRLKIGQQPPAGSRDLEDPIAIPALWDSRTENGSFTKTSLAFPFPPGYHHLLSRGKLMPFNRFTIQFTVVLHSLKA